MIINADYLLIATVGNVQYYFMYEASDGYDALEKWYHEDYPETIMGHDLDGLFPIDILTMSGPGTNLFVVHTEHVMFNGCIFHQFFDKGYVVNEFGDRETYKLEDFAHAIERKERKDEYNVSSFFYYMWNDWCKDECQKVFTGSGTNWQHFWSKWCGYCEDYGVHGAAERFYAALSDGNRRLLVKRALEVRDGDSRVDD